MVYLTYHYLSKEVANTNKCSTGSGSPDTAPLPQSCRTTARMLRGPILRASEGSDGAVLCNDDESLSGTSRHNSETSTNGAVVITTSDAAGCRREALFCWQ